MAEQSKVVAGVDVGKATLVAALRTGAAREFANTPAGHGELLAWLEQRKVALVVCEPSGGYEKGLVRGLHQAQRAVSLVAPGRARAYAKAMGQAAKTDPLDARLLARYGEKLEPEPAPEPEPERDNGQGTAGPSPAAGGGAGAGTQPAGAGKVLCGRGFPVPPFGLAGSGD